MNNHELIYQVDIRELFFRLKSSNPSIKTINDLPESYFRELKKIGVKYLWLLGIFEPSIESHRLAYELVELHQRYNESLPGWNKDDVIGSPFAIKSYSIAKEFSGKLEYLKFRKKIFKKFNMGIILDFVPNHTALDNSIVLKHPEYFIKAPVDLPNERMNDYHKIKFNQREFHLAHGKDPYFPSWKDTLQLDYRSRAVHKFMLKKLLKLSELCDGVRCDMSMLVLNEIFMQNWKDHPLPIDLVPAGKEFWYNAINEIKKINPNFLFIAEVYWDKERIMLDLGFNFVYDKKLYDCLIHNNCPRLRDYIHNTFSCEKGRLLFLENHDEQRAAAVLTKQKYFASATLTFTLPTLKLINDGQLEGRKYSHAIQLRRLMEETPDNEINQFYKKLFDEIQRSSIRNGYLKSLKPFSAWERSPSFQNFIIYLYENDKLEKDLVVINFSAYQSQCRVKIESLDLVGKEFLIEDRLSDQKYQRSGNEMFYDGLFLELMSYQAQIFRFRKL